MCGVQAWPCFWKAQWKEVAGPHLGVLGCPLDVQIGLNGGKVGHRQIVGGSSGKRKSALWAAVGRKGKWGFVFIRTTLQLVLDLEHEKNKPVLRLDRAF